jgi:hypothetical protein
MSQGRGMGEQVGGLGEHDYIRELWSVMLELALDLFQNYYQTAFCSL